METVQSRIHLQLGNDGIHRNGKGMIEQWEHLPLFRTEAAKMMNIYRATDVCINL